MINFLTVSNINCKMGGLQDCCLSSTVKDTLPCIFDHVFESDLRLHNLRQLNVTTIAR